VKLPFADEHFDAVVSNFVFHEVKDVKDKRAVIKEALRVLKWANWYNLRQEMTIPICLFQILIF
jgi:ubiquinone/menaquinone biosynthesis C-methylase UbiE